MWAALLKGVDLENQGQCLHAIHCAAEADLARVHAQRPEAFLAEVHAGVGPKARSGRRAFLRIHIEVCVAVLVAQRDIDRVGRIDGDPIPVRSIGRRLRPPIIPVLNRRRPDGHATPSE